MKIGSLNESKDTIDYLDLVHENKYNRARVARSTASIDLLELLSHDSEFIVREDVAENPNCPPYILERLSHDSVDFVRYAVLSNPNCPIDILERFSYSDEISRYKVGINKNCPLQVFARLAIDNSDYVRENIESFNRNKYIWLFNFLNNKEHHIVEEHMKYYPDCINDLKELAEGDNVEVKRALAVNKNCPLEILEILCKDKDSIVRGLVIKNRNITDNMLDMLSHSNDKRVLKSVFENPKSNTNMKYNCLSGVNIDDNINFPIEYLSLYELGIRTNNIEKYKDLYYYILLYKCSLFSSGISSNTRKIISQLNARINNNEISEELLYFLHGNTSLNYALNEKSLMKIKNIYSKGKTIMPGGTSYKDYYLLKIKNSLSNIFKKEKTDEIVNIYPYIKSISLLKNTNREDKTSFSRIQNVNTGSKFVISCDSIKYILDKSKDGIIEFGQYPQEKVDSAEEAILNIMLNNNFIKESNKKYTFDYIIGKKECPIYEVNDRSFINYNNNWIEIKPIKWIIDKENMSLTSLNDLSGLNLRSKEKIIKSFFEEVIAPYSAILNESEKDEMEKSKIQESEDSKKLNKKIQEDKTISDLNSKMQLESNKKLKEKQRIARIEELNLKKLELSKELDDINRELKELGSNEKVIVVKRVDVNPDYLVVKVDDHKEFNPKLIPYLKYINLSSVKTKNLKISGIDFRGTNLYVYDPKYVYNMDLSGSSFDDTAFILKDFSGCDLRGTDLSQETDCSGYEEAIVDENTKLPKHAKGISK